MSDSEQSVEIFHLETGMVSLFSRTLVNEISLTGCPFKALALFFRSAFVACGSAMGDDGSGR